MAEGRIEVEGGRQLRATLRKAGNDLGELKEAHRAASTAVAAAAQARAPRRKGSLAGSIRPGATKTAAIVRAGGARVPYANPIHWGWPRRHIEANPFITEAAQATEPGWSAMYEAEVARILGEVKGA